MKPLTVFDIECPVCNAPIGEKCTGRPRGPWHRARLRAIAAKVVPAKQPAVAANVVPIERRAA